MEDELADEPNEYSLLKEIKSVRGLLKCFFSRPWSVLTRTQMNYIRISILSICSSS